MWKKRIIRFVIPIIGTFTLGLLIAVLVFKIVQFSDEVTEYYTPTILAAENFLEASNHLKNHLKSETQFSKQSQSFIHFQTALSNLEKVKAKQDINFNHFNIKIFHLADQVLKNLNKKELFNAESILNNLLRLATINNNLHIKELKIAKDKIHQFSYIVAFLSSLVLVIGVGITYRGYWLQEMKRKQDVVMAAIASLINSLEARDPYTRGHSSRVAEYSFAIAKELDLPQKELENIKLAALLHDIGKIGVPDNILLKKDKLDDDEFKLIKNHPLIGEKILSDSKNLQHLILGIKHHHERYDGKGYPHGLKNNQIPVSAQIIAIADAFDAMTSSRPYREAFPFEKTLEIINKEKGKQWSGEMVEVFIKIIHSNELKEKIKLIT